MPPFIELFYHTDSILSILKIKLNSFVNFFALLYNNNVTEENKNTKTVKKSKKNKKLKLILVLVAVGIVLALTACLLTVFLLKPSGGGEVMVFSYDHQVFVKTDVKEDQRTYRFKFETNGQVVEINSDSNVLEITQNLLDDEIHLGVAYDVSVCLVEPSGILAGEYGKAKAFTPSLRLKAPQVSLSSEDNKTLSWQAVNYADYYTVCYYDGSLLEKFVVSTTQFDVSLLMGGDREIFVTSHSNRTGIAESEKSNVIRIAVSHELKSFLSGIVNGQTKQVSIAAEENVNGIVLIDEKHSQEYRIVNFTKTKSATGYIFSFNIGLVYTEDDQTFLVKPLEDLYNTFTGEAIALSVI